MRRRDQAAVSSGARRRLAWLVATMLLLTACGGAPGLEVTSDEPGGRSMEDPEDALPRAATAGDDEDPDLLVTGTGGIAPRCDDLDPLPVDRPDDVEPLGTAGTPIEDGLVDGPTVETLAPQVQAWAREHAGDDYAGLWFDHDHGGIVVAFTGDVDTHARGVREAVHPALAVATATYGEGELETLMDRIWSTEDPGAEPVRGTLSHGGTDVMHNRIILGLYHPTQQRLRQLSDDHGADAICFWIQDPPPPPSDAVTTLAKLTGWDPAPPYEPRWGLLEVAWDAETAAALWEAHVGDRPIDVADDPPATPGVYGDPDEVDLARQALAVWYGGESGSCPAYVQDVTTTDGRVEVAERGVGAGMCTDDFNPYRVVLAVDRDRLPAPDELPIRVPHDAPFEDVWPADVVAAESG